MNVCVIDCKDLIPTPWVFPLDKEGLLQLLSQNPKIGKNDFKTLYLFALVKMKEAGVTFFSPGSSEGRRFIHWFNSHFWSEGLKAPTFERDDFIFKEVALIFTFHSIPEVQLPPHALSAEKIEIGTSNLLNDLGKTVLAESPFLKDKSVLFL